MNKKIINIAFKAVGLAMGAATLVLSILNNLETSTAITLLSVGMVSLGIGQLSSDS